MPIYEYVCAVCAERFEALVPYAHRDEVACEKCGVNRVERLASTFASTASTSSGGAAMSSGSCCGGSCSCCGD